MILSDKDIREYLDKKLFSIEPLSNDTIRENGIDLRVGDELLRFIYNKEPVDINDKSALEKVYTKEKIEKDFVIFPQERVLIKIDEKIKMPNNLVGMCNIRSTFSKFKGNNKFRFGLQNKIFDSMVYVMHFPIRGYASIRVKELKTIKKLAGL